MRRQQTTTPQKTVLPRSPQIWDHGYISRLVNTIQASLDLLSNPSILRGGELFLSNLPTRGANLAPGYVFSDGGFLRIVREDDVFADSLYVVVSVGTVTVTT